MAVSVYFHGMKKAFVYMTDDELVQRIMKRMKPLISGIITMKEMSIPFYLIILTKRFIIV